MSGEMDASSVADLSDPFHDTVGNLQSAFDNTVDNKKDTFNNTVEKLEDSSNKTVGIGNLQGEVSSSVGNLNYQPLSSVGTLDSQLQCYLESVMNYPPEFTGAVYYFNRRSKNIEEHKDQIIPPILYEQTLSILTVFFSLLSVSISSSNT